jgi:soluble lytic murein transglycosylase-like protein
MGIFQDLLAKFNETKQRLLGSKQTQQIQAVQPQPTATVQGATRVAPGVEANLNIPEGISAAKNVGYTGPEVQNYQPLTPSTQILGDTSYGRNPDFSKFDMSQYQPSVNAITQAAEEYGIPASLLFDIAFQESTLNPNPPPNPDSTAAGLFQFTSPTWEEAKKRMKLDSAASRLDPDVAAKVAAYFISNGMLGRWNASKDVWGQFYSPEELQGYYP